VARRTRTDTTGSPVTAQVGLGKVADRPGYGLRVDLVVSLPALGRTRHGSWSTRADGVCPYSDATRGNVTGTHQVVAATVAGYRYDARSWRRSGPEPCADTRMRPAR
jgi:organic hydroperoxide reductase OsmC/OhrA